MRVESAALERILMRCGLDTRAECAPAASRAAVRELAEVGVTAESELHVCVELELHRDSGFTRIADNRPLFILLRRLECHVDGPGSRLSLGLGNTSLDKCVLLTLALHIKDSRCEGVQTVVLLPGQALELVFTAGFSVADKDTARLKVTKEMWCPVANTDALSKLRALLLAQGDSADRDFAIEAWFQMQKAHCALLRAQGKVAAFDEPGQSRHFLAVDLSPSTASRLSASDAMAVLRAVKPPALLVSAKADTKPPQPAQALSGIDECSDAASTLAALLTVVFGDALSRLLQVLGVSGAVLAGGLVTGSLCGSVDPASDIDIWVEHDKASALLQLFADSFVSAGCITLGPARSAEDAAPAAAALVAPVTALQHSFKALLEDDYGLARAEAQGGATRPTGRLQLWVSEVHNFTVSNDDATTGNSRTVQVLVLLPGRLPHAAVGSFDLTCVQVLARVPPAPAPCALIIEGTGLQDALARRARWGDSALTELAGLDGVCVADFRRTLLRGVKFAARGFDVGFEGWLTAFRAWRDDLSVHGMLDAASGAAAVAWAATESAAEMLAASLQHEALAGAPADVWHLAAALRLACAYSPVHHATQLVARALGMRDMPAAVLQAALLAATSRGRAQIALQILAGGVSPACSADGISLLERALSSHLASVVLAILRALPDAQPGDIVKLVASKQQPGAESTDDTVAVSPAGEPLSLLYAAARLRGQDGTTAVQLLLLRGGDGLDVNAVSMRSAAKWSPLAAAVAAGCPATVHELLAAGARCDDAVAADAERSSSVLPLARHASAAAQLRLTAMQARKPQTTTAAVRRVTKQLQRC